MDDRVGALTATGQASRAPGELLSATPTADGGFVATGWVDEDRDGEADLLYVSVDASGTERWKGRIDLPAGDEFGDCVVPMGPEFLVIGRTTSMGVGSTDLLLARISAAGVPVWQRTTGTAGLDGTFGRPRATVAPDGSYFVCAGRDHTGWQGDDLRLVRLSAVGAVVWERVIDAAEDTPKSVCATADGGCLLLGDIVTPGGRDHDLWLVKVDAAGSVEWERA
ncbi:MAG: hypothetical protein AAF628_03730 [Planctomycetota bacterium]